jgi:2-polyprenyl-3-methyl-5-hydroxy-6-metoxy-1,4-benzoquinol methylase
MSEITNPAFQDLVSIGFGDAARMEPFHPRTRDKPIPVFRDCEAGFLVLERFEAPEDYYRSQKPSDRDESMQYSITELASGAQATTRTLDDQQRRFLQFRDRLVGRTVCDYGSGFGGFLRLADTVAESCCGVELRQHCHEYARQNFPSIAYAADIAELDADFDVITMFHVLEHLPHALATLRMLRSRLRSGGRLIVEVPQAKDFLIQSVALPEFRDFTFWSEHLVLHTRDSLEALLRAAGFADIRIWHMQRYGYTNHLNWFLNRKPGGHETLQHLEDPVFEEQYREARERDGTSDTLLAEASF